MWGGFALAVLLVAAGAYRYFTRPDRLRVYAEHWLCELTGGEARVDRVEFSPFSGLSLLGVSLAVPESDDFDPQDNSLSARTVFRSPGVFLRLEPLGLLRGEVKVPEVVALEPELVYVQRSPDGIDNWQMMLGHRHSSASRGEWTKLPVIRFRNARLIQYRLTEKGREGGQTQILSAAAEPLPNDPHIYEIHLTKQATTPQSREVQTDAGRLRIDTRTLDVTASRLPALAMNELLFATTPQVQRWMDVLDLQGVVRPEEVVLSRDARRIRIALSDASLSVPIDEHEKQLDSASRHVRFEAVNGTIGLEGANAHIELEASFHGASVQLKGSARLDEAAGRGMDALAFDLKFDARDVPLPRDEPERNASEARFVRRWKHLHDFVRDFDGIGVADLSFELRKSPGAAMEFVSGQLRPKGVSARYIHFPYRIMNMSGTVTFRPDGTETIELKGLHGNSIITFSGWEGGFKTQAGDLRIRGHDIALDDDLRRSLNSDDQRLCERFGLQARMDIDAHLTRPDAPPGTPNNPWNTVIDVSFRDGMVRFDSFPYPLEGLRGKMRIAGGAFEIAELTARRGKAVVRAGGTARWAGKAQPVVDLQLEATGVQIDSLLMSALPESAKQEYHRLSPSGELELTGRLKSRAGSDAIDYDLTARVTGGTLTLPTAARLTAVSARLHIVPGRLIVNSLDAKLGASQLSGDGYVSTQDGEGPMSLRISCEHLLLDDDVRAALPPSVKRIWDDFHPAGSARVELRCARPRAAEAGLRIRDDAHSDESQRHTDRGGSPGNASLWYSLLVEPLGASATYEDFALPLEDLHGSFTATPDGVEIRSMRARSGSASMSFFGKVYEAGDHHRAVLTVQARKLRFDESLRLAMPRRIRRQWDVLKPRGEIDVDFQHLEFVTGGDSLTWRFAGQVDLHDVTMDLGATLSHADGTIRGSCKINEIIEIDAELALEQIRIDDRLLTDAFARVARSADEPIVDVELIRGRFYGGDVSARSRIDYGPANPTFTVGLDMYGVSLDQFLNARRRPDEPPVQAQGLVDAHLALAGQFGDPPSRRGRGQVAIREAQIVKIPWMLSILQVLNLTLDDNAFHDALFHFLVHGEELLLHEIDLRGKALSLVGAGVVNTVAETLDLTLLAGGPLKLPRIAVLSDLVEGVAREVMEVRVEGTLENPTFRANVVKSLRRTVETLLSLRRDGELGG